MTCGCSRRAERGSVPTSTPETSARHTIRLLRAPLQRKRAATAASESTTVASETEREHMMRAAYPLGGDFCGAALTAQLGWTAHNRRLPEVAPMSLPNRIGRGCCQHTISRSALSARWLYAIDGWRARAVPSGRAVAFATRTRERAHLRVASRPARLPHETRRMHLRKAVSAARGGFMESLR